MTPRNAASLLLVLSLMLALGTCNQAIMVAPSGSTITLFANPPFIAAHGDISVISGLVIEPSGQPVADGTVVQFFTNLGRIQEQGKTNDGVVRVNLISDSRSGTATVTAVSGGDVTAPPTTTTAAPLVATAAGFASAMSVTGASAVSAALASGTVTVTIGSARPTRVLLSVDPPRITANRSATVFAQVFDADGNPVANAPVSFTIDGAAGTTERLESGGRAVFTDSDGRAQDTLRTTYLAGLPAKTVVVRATTANGVTAAFTVSVN